MRQTIDDCIEIFLEKMRSSSFFMKFCLKAVLESSAFKHKYTKKLSLLNCSGS